MAQQSCRPDPKEFLALGDRGSDLRSRFDGAFSGTDFRFQDESFRIAVVLKQVHLEGGV
jgi:hypothetical protein